MSKPDDRRAPSFESALNLVDEARQTQQGSDLLMEVLREELSSTIRAHDNTLDKASDIMDLYAQIRAQLSSAEKDAFFLALLDRFQGMDGARQLQLRTIVRTHVQRIAELHNRKR